MQYTVVLGDKFPNSQNNIFKVHLLLLLAILYTSVAELFTGPVHIHTVRHNTVATTKGFSLHCDSELHMNLHVEELRISVRYNLNCITSF